MQTGLDSENRTRFENLISSGFRKRVSFGTRIWILMGFESWNRWSRDFLARGLEFI